MTTMMLPVSEPYYPAPAFQVPLFFRRSRAFLLPRSAPPSAVASPRGARAGRASAPHQPKTGRGRGGTKRRRPRTSPSSSPSDGRPKPRSPRRDDASLDDAKTMGEAIQLAASISDHLSVADKFVWLPEDEDLLPHFRTQAIHHERRRRWGSQLLEGLGQAALEAWEVDPVGTREEVSGEGGEGGRRIWTDRRLARAALSAALPMGCREDDGNGSDAGTGTAKENNRPEKEGAWIAAALKGLHVLAGCVAPLPPSSASSSEEVRAWRDILRGISTLIRSADAMCDETTLRDAVEARWAIRGLTERLRLAGAGQDARNDDVPFDGPFEPALDFSCPNLDARTSNLPFDVLAHCLPWQTDPSTREADCRGYPGGDLLPELLHSIPFNFDTLTTRTGSSVTERRGTAWLAEDGIGCLAYSGKLMRPAEVPSMVREIMRDVEARCGDVDNSEFTWDEDASALSYRELGRYVQPRSSGEPDPPTLSSFFDCALCNHYPDGDAACKFHTDPEHGTHWHRTTCVVSCGSSRGFAFRPIQDVSTWSEWDDVDRNDFAKLGEQHENSPAALQLFPGDVVFMAGECNDAFHHAVYSSPFDAGGVDSSRVSLVFKRALDRGGGRKGHRAAGEGRRSRRRNRRQ